MNEIAVIGAGITGVTTAYELLRRGFGVTVFDRHRYAAMETSYANGGHIAASDGELWTRWSTVVDGLRWMTRRDAPLLLNPWPDWHKVSWFAGFIASIPAWRRNTDEIVRMAIAARAALFDMADREGIAFDRADAGMLHLYRTEAELAHARGSNTLFAEAGLERREVSAAEAAALEPALPEGYAGGFYVESDVTGDVHAFSVGLAGACADLGAELLFGTAVASVEARDGRIRIVTAAGDERWFDGVVVCAGVASRAIARALGDRINIYPVKGYAVTVTLDTPASQAAAPRVGIVDDSARIVTSRFGDGRLRIAGTVEFNGMNRDIRHDRIRPLLDWCERNFPGVATEKMTPWAGLRPMTPSMMPRVGRGSRPGVFYNTGHGHLGWTLAGVTARDIAATIAGERD